MATLSLFQGKPYINIQVWVEGTKPSKQGVAFGLEGWEHVKSFMKGDAEVEIGMEAYADKVVQMMHSKMKTECDGCAVDHPSQHKHSCLMDLDQIPEEDVIDLYEKTKAHDVILLMAQKANLKELALQKPLEVYLLNKFCNRGAVIKTVLFQLKGENS